MSPPQSISTQSQYPCQGMIEKLSDKVLLNIFRYYLDAFPRFWPTLVHICRKWRHIVFTSQQPLNLRLFCSSGIPVSKALDCWPALPIAMEYGGSLVLDPPAPEDEVNIVAVLKRSDRVSSISLTVTTSLLHKLYAIERPFLALEDLILLSRDRVPLKLPSTFRWGPRLRRLHLTGITVPALLPLLHSSGNLVDLQLHEALKSRYNLMELTDALYGMAQLRSLSLHFPSPHFPSPAYYLSPPYPYQRAVLPALTRLLFRGSAEYLERLVSRIDAPRLRDIKVTVVDIPTFYLPRLGDFINRIEMYKSHHQAHILTSQHAITISLTQPGAPTCSKFRLFSEQLSEQQFAMLRIIPLISAFFRNVEDLWISVTRPPSQKDSFRSDRWLELVDSFSGVKWLHLDGNESTNIVRALEDAYWNGKAVLPALQKLYLPQPGPRHAPLSEDIVSLMTSRWRSGYPIGVEYERLCHISELDGIGPFSELVTIDHEMLSDDILLNIFRQYLDAAPRLWHILTHVCQRWQQVILRSPLGLQLRLYCTHGTPVLKNLDCWPPVPLVINYGGSPMPDPPAPEDEDNIIAALKQSDRVNSISLTLTISLLGKLSTISDPFSELEELVLLSQDKLQLTLPSAFRWGEHVRTLHVTRIAIPALPPLLSSSTDLVDLQLYEIPIAGYFPPQVFANVLSAASRLRSLSLHFLSFPPRRNYVGLPPPGGHRVVLPALTCFTYRGISKYLDKFVARIDAPRLGDIDITFFSQPTMDASQLGQFIERIGMQTPLSEADIQASMHAVSVSFKNSSTSTHLRLQIPCKQLDWQLSCMAQVCDQFTPFVLGVQHLVFITNDWSSGRDDVDLDGEQWLQIFRSFGGARTLSIVGELTTGILCALRPANEGYTTDIAVFPRDLRVQRPVPIDGPFWDAAQLLITSRGLSGHPIELLFECPDCNITCVTLQGFKEHLVALHACEIVCSYCGDFPISQAYIHRFRFQKHLIWKHPEVAQNDKLISRSRLELTPLQLDTLANRHSSLRKPQPEIVAPPTLVTAPYSQSLETWDPGEE